MIVNILVSLIIVVFISVLLGTNTIAIIGYILSSHINVSAGIEAEAKYALVNAIKIILIPTYLFIRLSFKKKIIIPAGNIGFVFWLIFISYCTITYFWTPGQYFAHYIKQIGFFYVYTMGFIVLYSAWRNSLITEKHLSVILFIVTVLAFFQTYIIGNPFGETASWDRLVSFTAKQQFAQFIFALFVIIITSKNVNSTMKYLLLATCIVLMLLNGSRTGFAAITVSLLIYYLHLIRKSISLSLITGVSAVALIAMFTLVVIIFVPNASEYILDSRLGEGLTAAQGNRLNEVGTMKDRLVIWDIVESKVRLFNAFDYIFGRGLSSGGELFQSHVLLQDRGGNRYFHNEYIRIFYELGILGSTIFVLFLLSLTWFALKNFFKANNSNPTLLIFMPGFLAFLSVENILSGGGNAGGLGILLLFSYAYSRRITDTQHKL